MFFLKEILLRLIQNKPKESEKPQRRNADDVFQLFERYFGFHETFVRTRDFRDEMVITIMTLASKARELAKKRLATPGSETAKGEYINAIRDYHHAVELAHTVHSDFENIPMHWSRFPEFFEHWGKGTKPPRQNPSAVLEEKLLLEMCS